MSTSKPKAFYAYAFAKGYRIKGGAVVTITRPDGRVRRHKVNTRRYGWILRVFSLASRQGYFESSSFDCVLSEPICEQVAWLKAHGGKGW